MPEYKFSPQYNPRHKEFKLTPEQLKRYNAGEKLEDILNEGNASAAEAPQQEQAPQQEGESEVGKAKVIGMSKYRELEERYENIKLELDKQLKTTKPNKEYETLLQQKDAAIAELRKELEDMKNKHLEPVDFGKLAEIENLKAEMQQSQDLFHEATAGKENAEKQIVALKNQVRRLEDALEEKTTLFEDLKERNRDLLQEVYPLKMLTFLKLKREVE